jgi:hypothetical protein
MGHWGGYPPPSLARLVPEESSNAGAIVPLLVGTVIYPTAISVAAFEAVSTVLNLVQGDLVGPRGTSVDTCLYYGGMGI